MAKRKKSNQPSPDDPPTISLGKEAWLTIATCQALTQLDLSLTAIVFRDANGQRGELAFTDVLGFLVEKEAPSQNWGELIEGYAYLYCTAQGLETAPLPTEQVEELLRRNGVELGLAFILDEKPLFLNREGLHVVGTPNPRWSDAVVAYFREHKVPEFPEMNSDEFKKWASQAIARVKTGG